MHLTSPRILIVDDSELIRRFLTNELGKLGAEVEHACDGDEAFEMASRGEFDLVISDLEMPRLDGLELCQLLKRNPATAHIPVIILTCHGGDAAVEAGFQAGAVAYLSKADGKEALIAQVREVLERLAERNRRLVMVVEDSPTISAILVQQLEREGYVVLTAGNGVEALELLDLTRPHLILSDIEMPEMDGREFCRRVNSDPELASIPFVVMSTLSDRAIMRQMLQYGAQAYLVKPFNNDQMIVTIEKLLSDHYLNLLREKETLDLERRMMLGSITSLVQALEARDNYTRGHSENVARMARRMGKATGLGQRELEMLEMGGRLHDLGKIGVQDTILRKPGSLTADEFDIIKTHPVIGSRILEPIPSLREVLPIVLHHHERLDGKGYPGGLRNDAIPFAARITAVADTFDALTSDRSYRQGMAVSKALEIIEGVRGSQLCPECVDLLLECVEHEESSELQVALQA